MGYAGSLRPLDSALRYPQTVIVDDINNLLYVSVQCMILIYNRTSNIVSPFAGVIGTCGYSGDGDPANNASLGYNFGFTVDFSSNLVYIADTNNYRVRVVNTTTNIITTFAGTGVSGLAGSGGLANNSQLSGPQGVVVDNIHNMIYIADGDLIRVVNQTTNIINIFAGPCCMYRRWYVSKICYIRKRCSANDRLAKQFVVHTRK
jgi:hypothetical protein